MPQIPLDAYRICVALEDRSFAIGFTTLSLVFGTKPFPSAREVTPTLTILRHYRLLNHHVYCIAVEPVPVPDTQSAQDHSTRCNALFPGYIHFATLARVDLGTRKGKGIVISPRSPFLTC